MGKEDNEACERIAQAVRDDRTAEPLEGLHLNAHPRPRSRCMAYPNPPFARSPKAARRFCWATTATATIRGPFSRPERANMLGGKPTPAGPGHAARGCSYPRDLARFVRDRWVLFSRIQSIWQLSTCCNDRQILVTDWRQPQETARLLLIENRIKEAAERNPLTGSPPLKAL